MTTLKELKADPCFVDAWHPAVMNSMGWFWKIEVIQGVKKSTEQKVENYLDHFKCQPVWARARELDDLVLFEEDPIYVEDNQTTEQTFLAGIIFDNQQDHLMFLIKWGEGGGETE